MNRVQIVVTMPQNAVFDTFFDKSWRRKGVQKWEMILKNIENCARIISI